MIEAVGWIGSVLFALCAVPQAILSWKQKHSDGLSWWFLAMWFFGEVLTIIYVSTKQDVTPLLANYYINVILLVVILRYKIWPIRKSNRKGCGPASKAVRVG